MATLPVSRWGLMYADFSSAWNYWCVIDWTINDWPSFPLPCDLYVCPSIVRTNQTEMTLEHETHLQLLRTFQEPRLISITLVERRVHSLLLMQSIGQIVRAIECCEWPLYWQQVHFDRPVRGWWSSFTRKFLTCSHLAPKLTTEAGAPYHFHLWFTTMHTNPLPITLPRFVCILQKN